MGRAFSLAFLSILLLSTSSAFSQKLQSNQKECDKEVCHGCVPKEHAFGFTLSKPPVIDADDLQSFPARGGKVDWGLALSGGGLRSAAFNIGVLKVLYDQGILDKVDVISSVSGGSYASYWLFTSYYQNRTRKFGEPLFAKDVFIKNMCKFQGRGNFFTNRKAVGAVFGSNIGAFRKYENAIIWSFGSDESYKTELNFLNHSIEKGDAPYFIINATLNSKAVGGMGRVFEITPTHMGNPAIGFYKWAKNGGRTLRLSESVTMSGAALAFKLKRQIPNFAPQIVKTKNLELSDGGHSENLGALALIRRGVENIIITDAEHDYDYKFEAYTTLKKLLDEMDIDFRVPDIEEFIRNRKKNSVFKSAVSMGYARSRRLGASGISINSRIFYVKMSRPRTVFPNDYAAECRNNPPRYQANDDFILASCRNKPPNNDSTAYDKGDCLRAYRNEKAVSVCRGGDLNCDGLAKFPLEKDMYVNIVQRYSHYLNCKTKSRHLPKVFSSYADFRYNFPQITTWDQSYYRDQLEALVGLGYLQALELDEKASVK